MKAAILSGIRAISLRELPKPRIRANEALVKVRAVGVCGSDLHFYLDGKIGDCVAGKGHILGHEVSGEVAAVGSRVKGIKPGTRVAIEPGAACGKCEYCREGRYNLCKKMRFLGSPPVKGAYCEYIAWPAEYLFPIPDSMSFAQAAVVETLSVGMYAAGLAELKPHETAAILGCGPIGLVILKALRTRSKSRVFVTDLLDTRLKASLKAGNVTAINRNSTDPVRKILELTRGRGVDVVFEAAGAEETCAQSVQLARPGGRVVWAGIPPGNTISIDPHCARRKELVIKFVRRFRGNYPACVRAVGSGKINISDLITHQFNLADISSAFRLLDGYSDGVIKAVINIP